jgi:beta-N-acetylhexosaminidase
MKIFPFLIFLLTTLSLTADENWPLEKKIGQLMISYFDGETMNEDALRLLDEAQIGGIILYDISNSLQTYNEVQSLCKGLQEASQERGLPPCLIGIDQEGVISRLQGGFTDFPGAGALGRCHGSEKAYHMGKASALEMASAGINLNFAPVVDVNSNLENPVIGVRAFSSDPERVIELGGAYAKGLLEGSVIPCIKHFPGHGDVSVDSHEALPVLRKNLRELEACDLRPFIELQNSVPMIMTAHLLLPELDSKRCATLSPYLLQSVLRERYGFKGILITDSLTMSGVTPEGTELREVALQALEAGNDLLLFGGKGLLNWQKREEHVLEIVEVHRFLLESVRSGRLSEARVNESLERVLKLKREYLTPNRQKSWEQGKHDRLAMQIARESLEIIKLDKTYAWKGEKTQILAPKILQFTLEKAGISDAIYINLSPSKQEIEDTLKLCQGAEKIIFCSYQSWKILPQRNLIQRLAKEKPLACIAMRDPQDLDHCDEAKAKIASYSPSSYSLKLAISLLYTETTEEYR